MIVLKAVVSDKVTNCAIRSADEIFVPERILEKQICIRQKPMAGRTTINCRQSVTSSGKKQKKKYPTFFIVWLLWYDE